MDLKNFGKGSESFSDMESRTRSVRRGKKAKRRPSKWTNLKVFELAKFDT